MRYAWGLYITNFQTYACWILRRGINKCLLVFAVKVTDWIFNKDGCNNKDGGINYNDRNNDSDSDINGGGVGYQEMYMGGKLKGFVFLIIFIIF